MSDTQDPIIQDIVAAMRQAQRLLFITGAGVSADSGLPTYRGIGGLYNDQLTDDAIPIETALSGEMLDINPALTWKYLSQIEAACRGALCNDAHRVIAGLQPYFDDVCVLTQNVDGFHRQAGSDNVIEIHGCIHELICTNCDQQRTVADYGGLEEIPPACGRCGSMERPKVVLFGEFLPERALEQLYEQLGRGFDMVFSIGTTSIFPYIAVPVIEASRQGVPTVEINPAETTVTPYAGFKLAAGAAASMNRIWEAFREHGRPCR